MSIKLITIKRLYAKSSNQCAFPKCPSPIIVEGIVVGDICHIRARRKNGPRYDATLSIAERDGYDNLLLLCKTCHKLIDSDPIRYHPEALSRIKHQHEERGFYEITPQLAHEAQLIAESVTNKPTVSARASGQGVSIAINGDVKAPITVNQQAAQKPSASKYPKNSIGADANMAGYVDYLFDLGVDYWKNTPNMTPGRLGKKIKTKFRLKTRTRNHISVERFQELVDFIVLKILIPSPVGKKHAREGSRLYRTFSEWRYGPM